MSHADLVPAMRRAARCWSVDLADHWLMVPAGAGHAAGLKVSAMVGGMVRVVALEGTLDLNRADVARPRRAARFPSPAQDPCWTDPCYPRPAACDP